MKTTNVHNLPKQFENYKKKNRHSSGGADITVTSLIDSPQVFRLKREHESKLSEDISDSVMSILGTAIHQILEDGAEPDHIVEQRFHATVDGFTISGAADVQIPQPDGSVKIVDWKTCSTSALSFNPKGKQEWSNQLNCYAALARLNGTDVSALEVVAICRDWTKSGKTRYRNYPECPVVRIDIPLWDEAEAYSYLESRVSAHRSGSNYECTDSERWMQSSSYAVMKDGRKTAVKIFDNSMEADSYIDELSRNFPIGKSKPEYSVVLREGKSIRCDGNYCGVREFCHQFKASQSK